ncbi:DUF397 domain-containing protein [Micromonospora sp. NPDC049081]|uniref:DUF397 domain-containing protein n=1 Tax=Micromonospora sp. NPDC049081 TaxID=3155150 RepID=UPI0033C72E05
MPDFSGVAWRKSTRSGSNANCAEAARVVGVRDSNDPAGPVLAFERRSWAAFVAHPSVRSGL